MSVYCRGSESRDFGLRFRILQLPSGLTNLALSSTPAMMPAKNAAQFSCPMSAGTETKALVTGELS